MKDIEWLKEEIEEDIKSWGGGNPDYFRGASDAYENVKDWLNQLDEPETLSKEWIDESKVYYDNWMPAVPIIRLKDLLVPKQEVTEEQAWNKIAEYYPDNRGVLQSILEHYYYGGGMTDAVVEKPVIPKFVADWIEERKSIADHWLEALDDLALDAKAEKLFDGVQVVYDWLLKNPDKFVDAYRFGYEVEEKQKYKVELPTEQLNHILTMHGDGKGHFFGKEHTNDFLYRTYLTEQEIKAIDERFWAFAVKVEELEE